MMQKIHVKVKNLLSFLENKKHNKLELFSSFQYYFGNSVTLNTPPPPPTKKTSEQTFNRAWNRCLR